MLTVRESILRMRYAAGIPSGTVLWSHLLPVSKETCVTHRGQGGGVRKELPFDCDASVKVGLR